MPEKMDRHRWDFLRAYDLAGGQIPYLCFNILAAAFVIGMMVMTCRRVYAFHI